MIKESFFSTNLGQLIYPTTIITWFTALWSQKWGLETHPPCMDDHIQTLLLLDLRKRLVWKTNIWILYVNELCCLVYIYSRSWIICICNIPIPPWVIFLQHFYWGIRNHMVLSWRFISSIRNINGSVYHTPHSEIMANIFTHLNSDTSAVVKCKPCSFMEQHLFQWWTCFRHHPCFFEEDI